MAENVIIIGGGVAGLSAAIYLARADLKPLVIAGSPPGGQLTLTTEVENYPGFESILGSDLVLKMRNQAIKFGARIIDENVINLVLASTARSREPFRLNTRQNKYLTKSIIIATGAKALWLNLPSEQRLRGKGVSACATCDGFFFKNKTVAVIGGGDTALEEALTLTKFAEKIYLIHRRDFFRASKIMQDRVLANKKIEVIWNTTVEEVLGKDRVKGIKIKRAVPLLHGSIAKKTMKQSNNETIVLDGVFVAIGHKPDTSLFSGKIKLDKLGYIELIKRRSASVKGIFAAGDCADPYYRQAATAAGTGVEAALEVEKYLKET